MRLNRKLSAAFLHVSAISLRESMCECVKGLHYERLIDGRAVKVAQLQIERERA